MAQRQNSTRSLFNKSSSRRKLADQDENEPQLVTRAPKNSQSIQPQMIDPNQIRRIFVPSSTFSPAKSDYTDISWSKGFEVQDVSKTVTEHDTQKSPSKRIKNRLVPQKQFAHTCNNHLQSLQHIDVDLDNLNSEFDVTSMTQGDDKQKINRKSIDPDNSKKSVDLFDEIPTVDFDSKDSMFSLTSTNIPFVSHEFDFGMDDFNIISPMSMTPGPNKSRNASPKPTRSLESRNTPTTTITKLDMFDHGFGYKTPSTRKLVMIPLTKSLSKKNLNNISPESTTSTVSTFAMSTSSEESPTWSEQSETEIMKSKLHKKMTLLKKHSSSRELYKRDQTDSNQHTNSKKSTRNTIDAEQPRDSLHNEDPKTHQSNSKRYIAIDKKKLHHSTSMIPHERISSPKKIRIKQSIDEIGLHPADPDKKVRKLRRGSIVVTSDDEVYCRLPTNDGLSNEPTLLRTVKQKSFRCKPNQLDDTELGTPDATDSTLRNDHDAEPSSPRKKSLSRSRSSRHLTLDGTRVIIRSKTKKSEESMRSSENKKERSKTPTKRPDLQSSPTRRSSRRQLLSDAPSLPTSSSSKQIQEGEIELPSPQRTSRSIRRQALDKESDAQKISDVSLPMLPSLPRQKSSQNIISTPARIMPAPFTRQKSSRSIHKKTINHIESNVIGMSPSTKDIEETFKAADRSNHSPRKQRSSRYLMSPSDIGINSESSTLRKQRSSRHILSSSDICINPELSTLNNEQSFGHNNNQSRTIGKVPKQSVQHPNMRKSRSCRQLLSSTSRVKEENHVPLNEMEASTQRMKNHTVALDPLKIELHSRRYHRRNSTTSSFCNNEFSVPQHILTTNYFVQ